ncbi:MAG: hypothetical protein HC828_12385 [Blastochloris sp.]|nr:hypothetical protein [Blastochloris sp.]
MSDEQPMSVLHLYHAGRNLRVEIAAASELAFEIVIAPELDYERLIADVCAVAPALMAYDVALMEEAGGSLTRPPIDAVNATREFVAKYRRWLINVSVSLPPFENLERNV